VQVNDVLAPRGGRTGSGRPLRPRSRAVPSSEQVSQGIALSRQFVYTTPLARGLATLALIRQASGDPAGAEQAITEAGQASPGPAGLLNPVPAQRARLLLAQGNLPAAARFPVNCRGT
jgi:LuxR family transcriptional regulator, maltose regulon positive regulatory protein